MPVVTRSQQKLLEQTLSTPMKTAALAAPVQKQRNCSHWRLKRKNQTFFGYFGYDAPSYGVPAAIKIATVMLIGAICSLGMRQAKTEQQFILFGLGGLWSARTLFGLIFLCKRYVGWLEALVDTCFLETCSLLSLVAAPLNVSADAPSRLCLWVGAIVCVTGACTNIYTEVYRHRRLGLVTTGPYAWTRHPNYAAEIVSFAGFAMAGGIACFWNFWVPICMWIGMEAWSVNDIESFLRNQYGTNSIQKWKRATPVAIFWRR